MGHYLLANVMQLSGRDADALAALARALANEFGSANTNDPWEAVVAAVQAIAREPRARWHRREAAFKRFGALFARAQPAPDAARLALLAASTLPLDASAEFAARIFSAVNLLGFAAGSPREWNRTVFEGVLLPWMRRALAAGRVDAALLLEEVIYTEYVKQTETESHFRECFALWKDDMREAGRRFAAETPLPQRAPPGPLPRIAFFVHNVTSLAHVQMLLAVLEGHAQLEHKRFEPTLFYFAGRPEVLERFRAAGVAVVPPRQSGHRAVLGSMRQVIAERGIDQLVWISLALSLPFAFAMRLAPAQTWWAMKYHGLETPEIDGYITGGGLEGGTKEIHGRTWRAGPVAGGEWTAPARAAEAAGLRGALAPSRVVFGTFGREEKLDSPAFLDAVARILKAVPDSAFLWTGHAHSPAIQQRFDAAGVADRCRFIGWVDTKLYAQVIDVFLDSFPFPCGFTLYEAMAAGKAPVLYRSAESKDTGANALVGPLLEAGDPQREAARTARAIFEPGGESLCLRAANAEEYVGFATHLGTDGAFRERVGGAWRTFVESFMADRARAAAIYAGHFESIQAQAARRGAA